ncbi:intradiol ring-cleavage dioxygenase [Streptomyces europaeiscabiei]|uniref:Intradiol ring-cleavage dioxygenase n=1 Tax=Streptomyces europaeiscabiei TaxID=146819 RepID=A0ABU4NBR4_9ACTN|nr:intradiol ring-cleavage dioxygenase [Streptomyces europaeiscabiei]MDX2523947.1 intradiol ring-cleavage dioxygenase [Streptomyces europaeiscabiei]MDX2759819.1 intradiol ring-cleavage dioxygenase [Streptomyces europaeiscabiei]MDX2770976.1 intradiol ring-cleavage dioxygenase [Streptomyces europaeiscabiei]MDX3545221.1 intradiol ring-cleavage dioxygenase [Streptomyces europaeiscabiei]MDX3554212.1 intradiol ring-cleavage dioxygenase [Streptomyces europaeiscabiei]
MTDTSVPSEAAKATRTATAADATGATSIGRRTVLIATGATAATLAVGAAATPEAPTTGTADTGDTAPVAAAAVCTLTKEMTEGPYYLDGQLVRADIREGKTGFPLVLTLTVVDDDTCAPLAGALVEIWHCDALGEYSGFVGNNGHDEPDNGTFLRGAVLSNSSGVARITTVYPGWYRGRCIHIHLKVHTNVTLTSDGSFTGGQELHTGQLFFDETVTTRVGALSPYSANTVPRTTLAQDSIYDEGGAASGLLTLTALGSSPTAGYAGSLTVGVESS